MFSHVSSSLRRSSLIKGWKVGSTNLSRNVANQQCCGFSLMLIQRQDKRKNTQSIPVQCLLLGVNKQHRKLSTGKGSAVFHIDLYLLLGKVWKTHWMECVLILTCRCEVYGCTMSYRRHDKGVEREATLQEIKERYHKLARVYHPDLRYNVFHMQAPHTAH